MVESTVRARMSLHWRGALRRWGGAAIPVCERLVSSVAGQITFARAGANAWASREQQRAAPKRLVRSGGTGNLADQQTG
jgi:hypothetical protein